MSHYQQCMQCYKWNQKHLCVWYKKKKYQCLLSVNWWNIVGVNVHEKSGQLEEDTSSSSEIKDVYFHGNELLLLRISL